MMIDKKIEILCRINSMLPKPQKLKIPSLLTDDYVEVALYEIETTIPFIQKAPMQRLLLIVTQRPLTLDP